VAVPRCSIDAIRASENFDAFMLFRSSPSQESVVENASFKWSRTQAAEQRPQPRHLWPEFSARCINGCFGECRRAARLGDDRPLWAEAVLKPSGEVV
jgi:hypothetical protein